MRGKELKIPASTIDLNEADFGEYMEKIGALTGVPIPNPEAAGFISNTKPPFTAYDDHHGGGD